MMEINVQKIIGKYANEKGILLSVLHDVQNEYGYIASSIVPTIAKTLNLSTAEVKGVISFYHHFRTTPPAKNTVQICRAEACQSMGARAIEAYCKSKLGVSFDQPTANNSIELRKVYCLGNCACAPSVSINNRVHGRLDEKKMEHLLDQLLNSKGEGQ